MHACMFYFLYTLSRCVLAYYTYITPLGAKYVYEGFDLCVLQCLRTKQLLSKAQSKDLFENSSLMLHNYRYCMSVGLINIGRRKRVYYKRCADRWQVKQQFERSLYYESWWPRQCAYILRTITCMAMFKYHTQLFCNVISVTLIAFDFELAKVSGSFSLGARRRSSASVYYTERKPKNKSGGGRGQCEATPCNCWLIILIYFCLCAYLLISVYCFPHSPSCLWKLRTMHSRLTNK